MSSAPWSGSAYLIHLHLDHIPDQTLQTAIWYHSSCEWDWGVTHKLQGSSLSLLSLVSSITNRFPLVLPDRLTDLCVVLFQW